MTRRLPVITRRAGIAGLAGLSLSAFSRAASRRIEHADDDDGPPPCCGNGPPNVYAYGIGQPCLPLAGCGPDMEFHNPFYGKKGTKEQYAWVFTPNEDVIATLYKDSGGNSHPAQFWRDPTGFLGIAWVLAPGYTLDLQWPTGFTPTFSTRPFGNSENL